jgi:hypothetical protein
MSHSILEQLKKFDISKIDATSKIVAVARAGCGKTTLLRDILYQNRQTFTGGLIFSPSYNSDITTLLPSIYVNDEYDDDSVRRLFKRQQLLIQKNGVNHPNNKATVIFDDCWLDKSHNSIQSYNRLFIEGRQFDIGTLLSVQHPFDVTILQLSDSDYIFIGRCGDKRTKQKVYERCAGIFPTFEVFCDTIEELWSDCPYTFMVIDHTSTSSNIEDIVFLYRPEIRDSFRLGCEGLWNYHNSDE